MKRLLLISALSLSAWHATAAITYQGITTSTGVSTTSQTVNTLSAGFIEVVVTDYLIVTRTTPSDNMGNTYVLVATSNNGSVPRVSIYYAYVTNPNASTVITETVTGNGYIRMGVILANGVATSSPVDNTSFYTSSVGVTTGTPSSFTPSVSGCMILTAVNAQNTGAPTIASGNGYTQIMSVGWVNLVGFSTGAAYAIQTTAVAAAQRWDFTASTGCAVVQAAFKPEPTTQMPSGSFFLLMMGLKLEHRTRIPYKITKPIC